LTLVGVVVVAPELFILLLCPPLGVALVIAVLGRRRADWRLWDSSLLICPLLTWSALAFALPNGKSLSNLYFEVFIIAWLAPIAILIRVGLGRLRCNDGLKFSVLVFEAFVAAVVFVVVPPFPE